MLCAHRPNAYRGRGHGAPRLCPAATCVSTWIPPVSLRLPCLPTFTHGMVCSRQRPVSAHLPTAYAGRGGLTKPTRSSSGELISISSGPNFQTAPTVSLAPAGTNLPADSRLGAKKPSSTPPRMEASPMKGRRCLSWQQRPVAHGNGQRRLCKRLDERVHGVFKVE